MHSQSSLKVNAMRGVGAADTLLPFLFLCRYGAVCVSAYVHQLFLSELLRWEWVIEGKGVKTMKLLGGKNAKNLLPPSQRMFADILTKRKLFWHWCLSSSRASKHHKGHFNARPSCLAFDCSIGRPVFLESRRILIMFRPDAVGAKHWAPYRNWKARTHLPSAINQNVSSVRQ